MGTKHTPVPWAYKVAAKAIGDEKLDTGIIAEIDGANRIVAECFGRVGQSTYLNSVDNAAFIVRAVNCHDELIEVLTRFSHDGALQTIEDRERFRKEARAAIRKAEEHK